MRILDSGLLFWATLYISLKFSNTLRYTLSSDNFTSLPSMVTTIRVISNNIDMTLTPRRLSLIFWLNLLTQQL